MLETKFESQFRQLSARSWAKSPCIS